MTKIPEGMLARIIGHRAIPALLIAFFGYFILWASLFWAGVMPGAEGSIVDFHAFHIAGQMAWGGKIVSAYDPEAMHAAQVALTGSEDFLHWAYPPPFDIVVAALALMPLGLSFFFFTALTFGGFLWVLHRLAGEWIGLVLLAIAPAVFVDIFAGQNGFLTAFLLGLAVMITLKGGALAGVPLGLMVIKPHLAVGLGVVLLARRHWAILALAAGVAVASGLVATAFLGTGVWPAFLHGAEQSGHYLERAEFPLFRMTSVYATLRTLGAGPDLAFLAQALVALSAVGGIGYAGWRLRDPRLAMGVAILGSILISPYNYDYDLTLLGLGLAILAPHLAVRIGPVDAAGLLVLSWLATGSGLATLLLIEASDPVPGIPSGLATRSFAAFACLALVIWTGLVLRRPARG